MNIFTVQILSIKNLHGTHERPISVELFVRLNFFRALWNHLIFHTKIQSQHLTFNITLSFGSIKYNCERIWLEECVLNWTSMSCLDQQIFKICWTSQLLKRTHTKGIHMGLHILLVRYYSLECLVYHTSMLITELQCIFFEFIWQI